MKGQVSVGCIVLRDHSEEPVLLLRRAFGKLKYKWCFVPGKVEHGESPRTAAVREVLEETGLSPREISFVRAFHGSANRVQRIFVAHVAGSPNVELNSEHTEWRWSSFVEAESLLAVPAQRRALHLAQQSTAS